MQRLILFLLPLLSFTSIYTYTLPSVTGETINLNNYHGKKILIVNTASNSQLANQYSKLEELYQKYNDSLIVLAVPSNSFGNEQEDDSALYEHITGEYGVTFPVAKASDVVGTNACGLYKWLTQQALNGVMNNEIIGDFQKFLIDGSGNLIGVFTPEVDPLDTELQNAITGTY